MPGGSFPSAGSAHDGWVSGSLRRVGDDQREGQQRDGRTAEHGPSLAETDGRPVTEQGLQRTRREGYQHRRADRDGPHGVRREGAGECDQQGLRPGVLASAPESDEGGGEQHGERPRPPRDPVGWQPLGEERGTVPDGDHPAVQGRADGCQCGGGRAGEGQPGGPDDHTERSAVETEADGRQRRRSSRRPATSRAASPRARPGAPATSAAGGRRACAARPRPPRPSAGSSRPAVAWTGRSPSRTRTAPSPASPPARPRGRAPRRTDPGRAGPRAGPRARRRRPGRTSPRSWPSRSRRATGSAPSRRWRTCSRCRDGGATSLRGTRGRNGDGSTCRCWSAGVRC